MVVVPAAKLLTHLSLLGNMGTLLADLISYFVNRDQGSRQVLLFNLSQAPYLLGKGLDPSSTTSDKHSLPLSSRSDPNESTVARVCALTTSFCSSKAFTIRVIVGGRTCSASASLPNVMGPLKTITERAESRGAVKPLDSSTRRRVRSRRIAVECRSSARFSGSG